MGHKFAIGEICLVRSEVGRYEGWRETEIIALPPTVASRYRNPKDGNVYLQDIDDYLVVCAIDGHHRTATEENLRKLPPHSDPSTWAEGVWQPKKLTVSQ